MPVAGQLADPRAALQDPLFTRARPDLTQLRAALVHAPSPAQAFVSLHRAYAAAGDRLMALSEGADLAATLQRDGAQGVPFFFLRIDKGGHVTKRSNATAFPLAEYGGACLRLDVHTSFRTPGRIVPHFAEMPDGSQFFVISRTVDRPSAGRHAQDNRLAVAMGCAVEHVGALGYVEGLSVTGARMTPGVINGRICPRAGCGQRAHQAVLLTGAVDERRRGVTRYVG